MMSKEVTCGERTRVDIGETTVKYQANITSLLASHALKGCDTVARLTGTAKCKAFTQLENGTELKRNGRK